MGSFPETYEVACDGLASYPVGEGGGGQYYSLLHSTKTGVNCRNPMGQLAYSLNTMFVTLPSVLNCAHCLRHD